MGRRFVCVFAAVVTMKKLLSRKSWHHCNDLGTHICKVSEMFGYLHAAEKCPLYCSQWERQRTVFEFGEYVEMVAQKDSPNVKLPANEKHHYYSRSVGMQLTSATIQPSCRCSHRQGCFPLFLCHGSRRVSECTQITAVIFIESFE